MKFYEFNVRSVEVGLEDGLSDSGVAAQYRKAFERYFQKTERETFIFISEIRKDNISGAVITSKFSVSPCEIENVIRDCGIEVIENTLLLSECFSNIFGKHIRDASVLHVIPRANEIIDAYPMLDMIFDIRSSGILVHSSFYGEEIAKPMPREELDKRAEEILWAPSLTEEVERVYLKPAVDGVVGIPVHYIFAGNDFKKRGEAIALLVSALYENKRIKMKRYADISVSRIDSRDESKLDALFYAYIGGAIVLRFRSQAREDVSMADTSVETIETICRLINSYNNEVQIILAFPQACEKEKELFFENLGGISFVMLDEGTADHAGAVNYLTEKAHGDGFSSPIGLGERVAEDRPYRSAELDRIYTEWSSNYLKRVAYPQYANVLTVENKIFTENTKGRAYEKLQKMVGIKAAKSVIDDALNYAKTQKLMAARNIKSTRASMHMVFTGNLGTAKTTVARLFAEIMRDNEVLANGHMVEVGRDDLVGRFVGWTAQNVQKKFKEARGGVLFIDEAYSLVDDRSGSFGDEAINTIVAEMENNRSDVVVIFAGYPKEMAGFLERNPGLRSRIAFRVDFEDYTADELLEITELMAKEKELKLDTGVSQKLYNIYKDVSGTVDFGNGRFVRNLLEKASMRQATRLVSGGFELISDDALTTLAADDFVYEVPARACAKIGFSLQT